MDTRGTTMYIKLYLLAILLSPIFLFSQGFNMNLFGGEGGQPYSYYADEISVRSLPAEERTPEDDEFAGAIAHLTLQGNAWIHLENDNVTIYAQSIVYSREEESIIASDEVSIIQKDTEEPDRTVLHSESEKATFFIRENRLVLEYNPIIMMGENTIEGEKITFLEDEEGNRIMNVHSGPEKRAHGTYIPARQDDSISDGEETEIEEQDETSTQRDKRESLSRE